MKLLNKPKFLAVSLLAVVLSVAAPVGVLAHRGEDDASNAATGTVAPVPGDDSINHGGAVDSGHATDNEDSTDDHHGGAQVTTLKSADDQNDDSLRTRAQKLLAEKREDRKPRSEVARQRACEAHEDVINKRFDTLGIKADRYLQGFNAVFTKVQAYQTEHQLAVPDYDTLVHDATTKQAVADAAVTTLKGLSGTKLDCTAADPASSVVTVRTAADDARNDLQAYRASLKKLVQTLLAAKTDDANTPQQSTEGGN